jgi:hypothetical protein
VISPQIPPSFPGDLAAGVEGGGRRREFLHAGERQLRERPPHVLAVEVAGGRSRGGGEMPATEQRRATGVIEVKS